jgi:succinate-semialdehyde dehydrogenase/glutarate-semialdehyde dehydrogenase
VVSFFTAMFKSINPYTQQILASFPLATEAQVEQTLVLSSSAQKKWKAVPVADRAAKILVLAKKIEQNHVELARLATLEMGKTFAEAKLEVLKCITACEYYAANTADILKPLETIHTDGRKVMTKHEPLGTVLGIFPWNFPYWQIIRSAIPVIMGGNTIIVKPAPNTPQCALALQNLINEAGLGDGIVQTLFVDNAQIAAIIEDNRINACTLTGSEMAGSAVAGQAAKHIKKSVLELGGSDPFIVLADADLDLVMKNAVSARFQNNGQSCIASKRYIVDAKIADDLLQRLTVEIAKLNIGDPMEESTNIGPLARIDLKDKLTHQVKRSVEQGAKVLYEATLEHEGTCFYPPTVLGNIAKNSVAYNEELFGPVLSFFVVNSTEEAIALANDTEFGLGSTIWSKNIRQTEELANELQFGQVFINAVTRSHTAFPFGGVKKSGYGREMGTNGLLEFCAVKTIWI